MPNYREFTAPPQLARNVECFWIATQERGSETIKRVTPDGCADIIYSRASGGATLVVVGAMTRFEDFAQPSGLCSVGIRFRPGMWSKMLPVSGPELTNSVMPLADIWGKRAHTLLAQLDGTDEPPQFAQVLMGAVPVLNDKRLPLERSIELLETSHGRFRLDDAAAAAGIGVRQFRRRCIDATGLSPKLLARILRFRYATELIPAMTGRHAELASECGYADQSHMIGDFQAFAGRTPMQLAASFG